MGGVGPNTTNSTFPARPRLRRSRRRSLVGLDTKTTSRSKVKAENLRLHGGGGGNQAEGWKRKSVQKENASRCLLKHTTESTGVPHWSICIPFN